MRHDSRLTGHMLILQRDENLLGENLKNTHCPLNVSVSTHPKASKVNQIVRQGSEADDKYGIHRQVFSIQI